MFTHVLIALGLSMDAFAVSVSNGICIPNLRHRHAFRAALVFGLFQAGMPILGWFLGSTFRTLIQTVDHWIAFGLLVAIGGKMIWESFETPENCECEAGCQCAKGHNILTWPGLLVLAIATSIDALAVGLSYCLLGQSIWLPALMIGVITFGMSSLGCELGRRMGSHMGAWAERVGGLVLIGIGVKILIEHLT